MIPLPNARARPKERGSWTKTDRKAEGEDKIIIAEHYSSPKKWLNGDEWDTVMNYCAFMDPLNDFLVGVDKHSENANYELIGNGAAFWRSINAARAEMPEPSYMIAMNELDNHDHSRFLTRTNRVVGRLGDKTSEEAEEGTDPAVFRQAVLLQFTWPGAPTIYYGDEAGMCGWTDPDCRRPYPWGRENRDIMEFYRGITRVHAESEVLRRGNIHPLIMDDDIVAYARSYKGKSAIIVLHTGDKIMRTHIPVWLAGIKPGDVLRRCALTDAYGYDNGTADSICDSREMYVELLPKSAMVFIQL